MPSTIKSPANSAGTTSSTRLGRYQIVDLISGGGMSQVYLAQSIGAMGFQRLVALKLIHENFTQDPEFIKMFIDEARIAMHLHHRNIVQVFDLDELDGTYFIAMEYVHGINLYNLYERLTDHQRWVEVPLALYLTAEICKGLHFAHTRTGLDGRPLNIVHRDISPQNVLISFEGEVKITDFGIATATEKLHETADGVVKGKYAYMAPERLMDNSFDARVDVFSAGVLLYELLTGENPFARNSAVATMETILGEAVPPPSAIGKNIPRHLDAICLRALEKDPEHRWPTAAALGEALAELAMELSIANRKRISGDGILSQLMGELCPNSTVQTALIGASISHEIDHSISSHPRDFPPEDLSLPSFDSFFDSQDETAPEAYLNSSGQSTIRPDSSTRGGTISGFFSEQYDEDLYAWPSPAYAEQSDDNDEDPTIAEDPAHLSKESLRLAKPKSNYPVVTDAPISRPYAHQSEEAETPLHAPRYSMVAVLLLLCIALCLVWMWLSWGKPTSTEISFHDAKILSGQTADNTSHSLCVYRVNISSV